MKNKYKKGYSLIELIVLIFIVTNILIVVGGIIVGIHYAIKYW